MSTALKSESVSTDDTDVRPFREELTCPVSDTSDPYTFALKKVLAYLESQSLIPDVVGHRVVHGGSRFSGAVKIDDDVLEQLADFIPLAPLHQPYNLHEINSVAKALPELIQVACFDTAFHLSIPEFRKYYALPAALYDEGVRRYGFHGLSYQYVASQLPAILGQQAAHGKTVVAHLGSGASLCGLVGLKSQATTMGFTALDGLPMATRCGQMDPGVLLYLLQHKKMSEQQIEDVLYRQSGLLGLASGHTNLASLLNSTATKDQLAIDYFVDQVVMHIMSVVGAIGGLNTLVFTGGVGENSALVRQKISQGLAWFGFEVDERANKNNSRIISVRNSPITALVIKTNEERVIA